MHRLVAPLALTLLTAAPAAEPQVPPVERGERTATLVASVRPWIDRGDRPAWAPKGDWIAYDRPDAEGYSRLWVAEPDGSRARCLTCEPLEFRKLHAGNATWHPSGEYLIFQVERPMRSGDEPLAFRTVPGGNRGQENLWAITFNGRQFWNLTQRGEGGGRYAAPRFSREGESLAWSQRLASGGGAWGRWALQVARFRTQRGIPRLKDVRELEPGPQRLYKESCDFAADDRGLLFAANLEPGQLESGMDLYDLSLRDGTVRRLTKTPDELDRFGRYSPNGRWIAWVSNRDIPSSPDRWQRRGSPANRVGDLWLMSVDGGVVERLTRFSDVFSSEYVGKMTAGPPAWSPEGDRLMVPIAPLDSPRDAGLYMVELTSPIGR